MKKIFTLGIGLLICNFVFSQSTVEYIGNIIDNLDKIETATYFTKSSASAPGDTLAFITYERYVNMFINPLDTFVGASFSTMSIFNHEEIDYCYDGTYSIRFNWENKFVQIDTVPDDFFKRPMAPFFIRVKTILTYTKENIDNSIVKIHHYQDSSKIIISFPDRVVECVNLKPAIWESQGKVSRYEITIDKNLLPYRITRKMPHQTSWETCTEIKISEELDYEFNALSQIPFDFEIKGHENEKITTTELEGKVAKGWNLIEVYGDSVSLENMKSKVILIQFTGIGCGPCHQSIPFLKQLVLDNKDKDFELVCIEAFSENLTGMERYKDKNELNFKFLSSKESINKDYKIRGVPTFFVLDEKRVIRKVIVGYKKGETEIEITNSINKLL